MGKETVQNILVFRFANGIFENVWNRNYIDHIEITAAESIGIEGRGPFYEQAGALRDVIQNHVMQLLSFVAMEPPISFEAASVRAEKLKVFRAIKPIHFADTVRGSMGRGWWMASRWWGIARRIGCIRGRRRRPTRRCGSRLRTGAGRVCRFISARANARRSG
jgi:glucose-6-phosphate 1-dehydrogenase